MDLLYILGSGTCDNYNEIRYSLRSVERYVKNVDRVIVIGEDAGFFSDEVEFCPVKEVHGNKGFRISQKIMYAVKNEIVWDRFMYLSDDYFFTREIDAENYPYYHRRDLMNRGTTSAYGKILRSTAEYLQSIDKPTLNYELHVPIIYDAKKFRSLQKHFKKGKADRHGFTVRSLYGNIFYVDNVFRLDSKMNKFDENLLKVDCFSCSDVSWRTGVKEYLQKEFPNKSKYEK